MCFYFNELLGYGMLQECVSINCGITKYKM